MTSILRVITLTVDHLQQYGQYGIFTILTLLFHCLSFKFFLWCLIILIKEVFHLHSQVQKFYHFFFLRREGMRLCSRFLAQKVCCEFCVLLLCTIFLPALKFFWCRLYMFLRMGSYHWPPYYFFFLPGFIYLKLFRIKTIP